MNGREIFATVIFALAVVGAVRVLRLAVRSLKNTFRAIGLVLRTVGEKLASGEQSDVEEQPEPTPAPRANRRVRAPAPKASIPTITDADIAAYLAKKGAAAAAGN